MRGKGNRHATALVHTSQHIDAHVRMADAIEMHLAAARQRIERQDAALLGFWKACGSASATRARGGFRARARAVGGRRGELPQVAQDAVVITDNSRSQETLHFDDEDPRVIVAVGGNTLSRGLTLEGLSVSFFVRTASAYDTLLQMGRWFGYRNGYADLTRIWMTDEMREWFHHLATVEDEIRYDVERYETEHMSPTEFGVQIRTHPKLAITAAAKMQHAQRADASYSGRRIQTILFNHRDADGWKAIVEAAQRLVESRSAEQPSHGSTGDHGPRPRAESRA